jgi:uncharacterized surface protein with fasciclin (FAS1) repeats
MTVDVVKLSSAKAASNGVTHFVDTVLLPPSE